MLRPSVECWKVSNVKCVKDKMNSRNILVRLKIICADVWTAANWGKVHSEVLPGNDFVSNEQWFFFKQKCFQKCVSLTFIEQSLFGLLSIDVYIYIYNYTNIHKMTYFLRPICM